MNGVQQIPPVNLPAPNLQWQVIDDEDVDGVLLDSIDDWINAQGWDILFLNRGLFQIVNPRLIPINTEGVWRVDNRSMLDRNRWVVPSLARTLHHGQHARFNYRLAVGNVIPGTNVRLHRRVVRREFQGNSATAFVQYRFIQITQNP